MRLKTRWRDGTTHILMERSERIERLIPLIPPPRAHQVRYHGILAPSAASGTSSCRIAWSARVTASRRHGAEQPSERRARSSGPTRPGFSPRASDPGLINEAVSRVRPTCTSRGRNRIDVRSTRPATSAGCGGLLCYSGSSRSTLCDVATAARRCVSSRRSKTPKLRGASSNASSFPHARRRSETRSAYPKIQRARRMTGSTIRHPLSTSRSTERDPDVPEAPVRLEPAARIDEARPSRIEHSSPPPAA